MILIVILIIKKVMVSQQECQMIKKITKYVRFEKII